MKTILDLLHEDGFQPRKVGAKHGGEYHSPCPGCGGRDRFVCWPEASGGMGGGLYWCRGGSSDGNGCALQGDAVQYLRDFRGLSFAEAREYLGMRDDQSQRRSQPVIARPAAPAWAPVEAAAPPALWREKGAAFVAHCEQELARQPQVLEWLRERGVPEAAAQKNRLGFHVVSKGQAAYRLLSTWGLDGPRREDGSEARFVLLPGLVIPWFDPASGALHKLKVREFECAPWPEWAKGDKYREVRGSNQRYSVYGQGRDLAVVVETELDAMLLAERVGDLAVCVATGSAQRRPDAWAARRLAEARLVLNALDSDDAGAKAAWTWWAQNFPNAKRWPVPKQLGKDPGDLARAGVDVRLWIEAGVRRYAPALLATAAPHISPVQPPPVAQPAPVPPRAASTSWPVPEGAALADMTLPPRAPDMDELLRALRARPLSDPGCVVPCPRTRPPFWWSYFKDCEACAGHPHCLLELVRSGIFQEVLNGHP